MINIQIKYEKNKNIIASRELKYGVGSPKKKVKKPSIGLPSFINCIYNGYKKSLFPISYVASSVSIVMFHENIK